MPEQIKLWSEYEAFVLDKNIKHLGQLVPVDYKE